MDPLTESLLDLVFLGVDWSPEQGVKIRASEQ